MNDKQLKQTLIVLAEDGVPAADLWPALRARLAARPAFAEKGTLMLKPVSGNGPALAVRALGTATLILLLLAAALLVTPQGRAWAQSVWQYFTVAPADSFAVEPVPAPDVNAPTAEPPSVNANECGADMACQVASAAELLGYAPIVPAEGFAGLRLEAVQVAGDILNLSYTAQGGGGLVLSQGPGDLTASHWDEVAPEAVQAVQVNGTPAEFVQGTFVVYPDSSTAVWEPSAPVLRLRWERDGRTFELAKLGAPEHLEHLDQAALIALAETIR
jgi:hypothetical protein